MNTFYHPGTTSDHTLSPEESRHAVKILRLKKGDIINLADGEGSFYTAQVTAPNEDACGFDVIEHQKKSRRKFAVHIAMAPTKNIDRTEWFVEKACEIGIEKISFFITQHSERQHVNIDRIRKVAISAIKQSGNPWLPEILDICSFNDVLSSSESGKFIASALAGDGSFLQSAKRALDYIVLIGPEGDFTEVEIKGAIASGFQPVSLGENRLRTETAALVACHILTILNT